MAMEPLQVLDRVYYHNTLREWLLAVAIAAGVFVGLFIVRQIARRYLARGAEAGHGAALAADLTQRTRYFFFLALALAAGSLDLELPARWRQVVDGFVFGAVCLQIALWGDGLINYGLHGYAARRRGLAVSGDVAVKGTAIGALGTVARIALWITILIVVLDGLGVRVTTLIAGLGITGIAIALALQNVLGDVFAALSIVTDKPFVVGDSITVDTISGTVERIGLKTTRVRADTGEMVVVGNGDLLKSRIRNFGQLQQRTLIFTIVLDQKTPADALARVPGLIREVVTAQSDTRFVRSNLTLPRERGIALETVYTVTTPDYQRFLDVQQATTLGLLRGLQQANIQLAEPPGATVVIQAPQVSPDPAKPR
jgi:small-conductance mechanosensitive channel